MLSAGNEELKKEQLKERLIKLTQSSVLRNKPLNGKNLYNITDAHPEKKIENITPGEPDNSSKLEQTIAISEHLVQPENSSNKLPINIENNSEKLERLLH